MFTEVGYVAARMSDIADRGGVAVQTVYFVFHTKSELLQACFDYAVLGPERLPPMEQPHLVAMHAARSGRAAVAAFVQGNTAILGRSAAIKEVADSVPHEPGAAAVVSNSERLRREGLTQIVEMLAERFGLRSGLSLADATDLLLTLSASSSYLTLKSYGWSEQKYVEWLTDALARQLLAQPGRAR